MSSKKALQAKSRPPGEPWTDDDIQYLDTFVTRLVEHLREQNFDRAVSFAREFVRKHTPRGEPSHSPWPLYHAKWKANATDPQDVAWDAYLPIPGITAESILARVGIEGRASVVLYELLTRLPPFAKNFQEQAPIRKNKMAVELQDLSTEYLELRGATKPRGKSPQVKYNGKPKKKPGALPKYKGTDALKRCAMFDEWRAIVKKNGRTDLFKLAEKYEVKKVKNWLQSEQQRRDRLIEREGKRKASGLLKRLQAEAAKWKKGNITDGN